MRLLCGEPPQCGMASSALRSPGTGNGGWCVELSHLLPKKASILLCTPLLVKGCVTKDLYLLGLHASTMLLFQEAYITLTLLAKRQDNP
jgi:hypothetical protein